MSLKKTKAGLEGDASAATTVVDAAEPAARDGRSSTTTGREALDEAPFPRSSLIRFIAGYVVFWLFVATGVTMIANVLMPQWLKDVGEKNPAGLLGAASSIAMLVAMVANVLFGAISDRTRSRFGRRTPWLVVGGLVSIASFALIGSQHSGFGVAAMYAFAQIGLNIMYAPFYAVLSDRVPQRVRGTVSAANGLGNAAGGGLGPLLGSVFILSPQLGIVIGSIMIGLGGIVVVLVFPREPRTDGTALASTATTDGSIWSRFVYSFTPPRHCPEFWKAFCGRTCVMLSYQMIVAFVLYIAQDYIGLSTKQSGEVISIYSVIVTIMSFVSIVVGPLSDRMGRRKLPVYLSVAALVVGFVLLWLVRSPGAMYGAGVCLGLGYGAFTSIDQALNVDVLPNAKDAGKDLGFINVATTAGLSAGSIVTSAIVTATGGYFCVFPVAAVLAIAGAIFVSKIKIVR